MTPSQPIMNANRGPLAQDRFMSQSPYDLPPLTALASFEAAARHESFKAAAQELNVTPAAISHQVKALEAELRQVLFRRHHRGVSLTETGAYLLVALQRGFEEMAGAVDQLRSRATRPAVTIRATTAVSALWLTPRLGAFWRAHGHITVAQNVSDLDSGGEDSDLAIHYGDMARDSGDCRLLIHDCIKPLASPRFAARHAVRRVADFERLPLVHVDRAETGWTSWRDWCRALGHEGPVGGGLRVNNYVIGLQAAEDDMGAVLGWEGLTSGLERAGRLVPLLDVSVPSPLDFYIKVSPHASHQAHLLCDWLVGAGAAP
ncbi:Transcriptional regulator (plasmid) [Marinovum algicola DG 898]|nr:Transcriptional regulator [Marinovum algicola DG 898]